MKVATIYYTVQVAVTVDLREREVTRVVVLDELPTPPRTAKSSPEWFTDALAIAESAEWPAWEFGP